MAKPTLEEITGLKRKPTIEEITGVRTLHKENVFSGIDDPGEAYKKAGEVVDLSAKYDLPFSVPERYLDLMTGKPVMTWKDITPEMTGLAKGGVVSVKMPKEKAKPMLKERPKKEPEVPKFAGAIGTTFGISGEKLSGENRMAILEHNYKVMVETRAERLKALAEYYYAHPERKPRQYKNFFDELLRNHTGMHLRSAAAITGNLTQGIEYAWGPSYDDILSTESMYKYAESIYDKSRSPDFSPAIGGGWRGFVASTIGQVTAFMAGAIGASWLTGTPLGAFGYTFAVEGDEAYRTAIANGATEEEANLQRFVVGSINGAIEQLQISQLYKFSSVGRGSIKQVAKEAQKRAWKKILAEGGKLTYKTARHAIHEGFEETLQEFTMIASESKFNPQVWDEAAYRLWGSGLGGGIAGLIFGVGGNIVLKTNQAVINKNQQVKLQNALQRELGISPMLASKASQMVADGTPIGEVDAMLSQAMVLGEETVLEEVGEPEIKVEEQPPAPPAAEKGLKPEVPITKEERYKLEELGYKLPDIRKMKPLEARELMKPSKQVEKKSPVEAGQMDAGFIEIPPITTAAKIEEEHPNIRIVEPKKDIGVLQKHILSLTNQAQNTKNPDIIEAANTMADIGMVIHNEIGSQLAHDKEMYKRLPKEYQEEKGKKFFELMDKHYSPEQIDKAKDVPEDVKPILKHFKVQEEVMRQDIIKQKRAMSRAIHKRQSVKELQKDLEKYGIKYEIQSRKVGGLEVESLYNPETEEFIKKDDAIKQLVPLDVPDDWGRQWSHIQHIFFGQYQLQWIEQDPETGKIETHFIGRAENQTEAYEKLADWKAAREAAGFDDADEVQLEATPEFHIPYDVLRISRKHFYTLEKQIQEAADIQRREIEEGLRGIIGKRESKQKWWGALMKREGKEGYSEDFWRVWSIETSQFNRWKYLSEMNRKVQPHIENLRRQGLRGWAQHLEDTKDFMWGRKRSEMARQLDKMLIETPVVKNYVKPFAEERWTGMAKTINYWRHLQTGRFYVINSMQLAQTLWPVVGEKGFYRGIKLYYSKEGQNILQQHKVAGISGKLHEIGMKRTRAFERFTPAGASELRNQGIAFLALYDDGIKRGMGDAEAAKYARLRGQLFTQFTYTQADIPSIMRGPIGGLVFQYKRFTIKNLELVSRLAREGNWGGVARWLAALLAIGGVNVGLKVLPFGGGYLAYKYYKKLEEEYGKEVADVIHHGLPGLLGIDMSGSVTPIDVPYGENIYEKTGNIVFGPTGTTAVKMIGDVQNLKVAKDTGTVPRAMKSLVDSSPAVKQFVFLVKALQKDTTNYDAKQRYQYELETWDLWKKALGFRPETETLQRMQFDAMLSVKKEYDETVDHIILSLINGDTKAAKDELQKWQTNYPEVSISGESVIRRIKERGMARTIPISDRAYKNLPKNLRELFKGGKLK